MFLELPDRVVIVTGAARGIGFAVAERLSRAGARVVVADVDEEGAMTAVERLRERLREGLRRKVTLTQSLRLDKARTTLWSAPRHVKLNGTSIGASTLHITIKRQLK